MADIDAYVQQSPTEKQADRTTRPWLARVQKACKATNRTCEVVVSATLIANIVIVFSSVIDRIITGSSLLWSDSLTEVLLSIVAFLGGVTGLYGDEHVRMGGLRSRVGPRARSELDSIVALLMCCYVLVLAWQSVSLASAHNLGTFPQVGWPTNVIYIPLAVGAVLLFLLSLVKLVEEVINYIPWTGLLILAVLAGVTWYVLPWIQEFDPLGSLIAAMVVLFAGVVIGLPIAMSMGIAASAGILLGNGLSLDQVPLAMTDQVINLDMIALSFFVIVGIVFAAAGVGQRLNDVVSLATRRIPGGDRLSGIISMFLFSGLSGSKIADVAAVAPSFMDQDAADDRDEDTRSEMCGVLSASAVMGEAVPPSNVMLVLGAVTTVSTGALFLAGIVPAILVGACIAALVVVRGRRRAQRADVPVAAAKSRRVSLRVAWDSVPALIGLVVVVGGILSGIATPAESSAVAVIYGIVIALGLYRIGLRALSDAIIRAARLAGMLLFLISSSGALSSFVTSSGLGQYIADAAKAMNGHAYLFLALTIVLLIVMGSVFEGVAAIIVLAPLLVPLAAKFDVNAVQYCVLLLLSMGIGAFIPPFGMGYYATCAILKVAPNKVISKVGIYMAGALVGICVVAMVPSIALALPHLLHVSTH